MNEVNKTSFNKEDLIKQLPEFSLVTGEVAMVLHELLLNTERACLSTQAKVEVTTLVFNGKVFYVETIRSYLDNPASKKVTEVKSAICGIMQSLPYGIESSLPPGVDAFVEYLDKPIPTINDTPIEE